jgi:hypothetical protein
MLYMVIETFDVGIKAVYTRFQDKGRMLPDGLNYIDSWVSEDLHKCFQIMSCDDPTLIDTWIINWSDIVTFEVVPIMTSEAAITRVCVSSSDGTC